MNTEEEINVLKCFSHFFFIHLFYLCLFEKKKQRKWKGAVRELKNIEVKCLEDLIHSFKVTSTILMKINLVRMIWLF